MAVAVYVPAWKRLGLKLKYAKDTADSMGLDDVGSTNGQKRKEPSVPGGQEVEALEKSTRPNKKVKVATPPQDSIESADPSSTRSTHREGSPLVATTPTKRQKSVSFTPETKKADGDSIKKLYQKWLSQPGQKPDFAESHDYASKLDVVGERVEPSDTSGAKKLKRVTNSKFTSLSNPNPEINNKNATPPSSLYISPFLQYLNEFRDSREQWKFNKSKQNQLLKHVFDVKMIPPSYNSAIGGYVKGLQGEAVCARIREAARKACQADDEVGFELPVKRPLNSGKSESKKRKAAEVEATEGDLAEYTRRAQDYKIALARVQAQLKEGIINAQERDYQVSPAFTDRLLSRQRAELLLWAVGATPQPLGRLNGVRQEPYHIEITTETRPGAAPGADGQPAKKVRKRKRRTNVPDDDTSSDETDSDEGKKVDKMLDRKENWDLVRHFNKRLNGAVPAEVKALAKAKMVGNGEDHSDTSSEGTSSSESEGSESDDSRSESSADSD